MTMQRFFLAPLALSLLVSVGVSAQTYDPSQAVQRGPFENNVTAARGLSSSAVANGGFELNGGSGTNILNGWTVVDQANSFGSWYALSGTTAPESLLTVPAPPGGSFAAVIDQQGPGSHVLYQDITVPASGGTLSFDLFLNNTASDFTVPSPATLDFSGAANQQFRVDIMSTTAGDFDVGAGVLANVYQTNPGDPLTTGGYTNVSFNLAAFAGQTVRLRFAEVDNQLFFNVGIDNVRIAAPPLAVPVTERFGLVVLALLVLLIASMGLRTRSFG